MQSRAGSLNYFLIFASKHFLGLQKMKEAMKRLDQDGSYCFADSRHTSGQMTIFRFDDPEPYAARMHASWYPANMKYAWVRDYALNETPFQNPKKMLAILEKQEKIVVLSKPGTKRRKGSFKEEDIDFIQFV